MCKEMAERIEKGDEGAVTYIDDPTTLQELCDKGNKTVVKPFVETKLKQHTTFRGLNPLAVRQYVLS